MVNIVNKFTSLLVPLLLILLITACGGDSNNQCTEIETENNFLLIFQGCPNNGLKEVCNSFECTFTPQFGGNSPPPEFLAEINPRMDCSRIDRCVNLDCDLLSDTGEIVGEVILSTLEILPGNEFVGAANLNGTGPFDFTCSIILP